MLLFFDPSQRISKVDKQLCDYIAEPVQAMRVRGQQMGSVRRHGMPTERWVSYLHDTFRTMWYVPIAFITGQTGKNVKALLNHAQMLFKQARHRVATGELNRIVHAALETNPPPLHQQSAGRRFITPRRSASSRRRSCCFATIRRRSQPDLSALFAGRVPRSAAVCRSADQALLAPREDARATPTARSRPKAEMQETRIRLSVRHAVGCQCDN